MQPTIRRGLVATAWKIPPQLLWRLPTRARGPRVLRLYEESLRRHPRDFVTRMRNGQLFSGSTRDVIQRYVCAFGVWEPEITQWLTGYLRSGDVVIDVGANTGYFALVASGLVGPSGRVYAIEPVPSIRRTLDRNIALNRADNIAVLPIVASDVPKSVEVFRASDDNLGTSSTVTGPGFTSEGLVAAQPLDEALSGVNPESVRLVKIDTEGDEANVLAGMSMLLRGMPAGAAVLVEVAPERLAQRGLTEADVWRHFPADTWTPFRVSNDYSIDSYVTEDLAQPVEIDGPQSEQSDVIFVKH